MLFARDKSHGSHEATFKRTLAATVVAILAQAGKLIAARVEVTPRVL